MSRTDSPVDQRAFVGQVIRCRVTQRFEIYNPHSIEQLRAVKEMGFTQVILDWPNLHADATALGLDVVLANWWTPDNEVPAVNTGIANATLVDRRRLVGVSMMDEPERNSPETPFSYYEALYQDLRDRFDEELPGVKLEISHWGPLRSWTPQRYQDFATLYRGTDRIRIMPYPDLDEGPLEEVYFQMMRSRRVMELAGRELPLIVILQTWFVPEDPKLPTIDELRVMAYQALLCGAETVSFFSYDPDRWRQTQGFTESFTGLMSELTDFSRRYRTSTVESRMDKTGVLRAELTLPDGSRATVLVNTNRREADGLTALAVTESIETPARIERPHRWRRRLLRFR